MLVGQYIYSKGGYKGHHLLFDTDGKNFVVDGKNKKGQTRRAKAHRVSEMRDGTWWEWEFPGHSKPLHDTNVAQTLADHVCKQLDKDNGKA